MAPTSSSSLRDALRQHRLLDAKQLEEVNGLTISDPKALAKELIQRGWLTPYQANQLLNGKGQELVLGAYILLERLGEGGMGQVFKARHRNLGRISAVKLIRKERLDNPNAVRRFQREVRSAAALSHPNIVLAFDADEIAGTHLMVMEYIEGAIDLAKLVKKNGPLPVERACEYIRQAALGLQHAYERGMVHRDIKPANLLLTAGGKMVKVLDMGLARLDQSSGEDDEKSSTMTQEGAVMGTPDYIAPEQALDTHTVDIRGDLYSLGCTFYYLLTGRVPFPGGTFIQKINKHQFSEPMAVEKLRPEVPAEVGVVVRILMAKKPEDRYQTPAEVAATLAQVSRALTGIAVAAPGNQTTLTEKIASAPSKEGSKDTLALAVAYMEKRRDTVAFEPPLSLHKQQKRLRWLMVLFGTGLFLSVGLAVVLLLIPNTPAEKKLPDNKEVHPVVLKKPPPRADGAWLKQVAALPASKQASAVAKKLQELNPGFDGNVTHQIEAGVATELQLVTDKVTDLSPLQALTGLNKLDCSGSGANLGGLANLWPLQDMKLTSLRCSNTQLSDLRPLKGLPLTTLAFNGTPVFDLSPLKDMKLTHLECAATKVSDLSPLKGLALTFLACWDTPVSSLTPLQGMRLTQLWCARTEVNDLSPLKEMKLTVLSCDSTKVSDLAPLKKMPLTQVSCNFRPFRDAEILRAIKTLEKINGKSAADFWKEEHDRQTAFDVWVNQVAGMPAAKQTPAVAKKLQELNPGFDGNVTKTIEADAVIAFYLDSDNVTDISPVRALKSLKKLVCTHRAKARSKFADLSPLRGLGLTYLYCSHSSVSDLSPLTGMKLTSLTIFDTSVADLSPLKDMHLTRLGCWGSLVADLSPLKGMPLTDLRCTHTRISSLSPLQGCPLTTLHCRGTKVSDLSPLKDMKLTALNIASTGVGDLSPLKNMPLAELDCKQTKVADFSPLKDSPIKALACDFKYFRDDEVLRSIHSLEKINDIPVKEFWREWDDKQAPFKAWLKQVAALPAEKQVAAVAKKLQELNPGFNGKAAQQIEGGVVTGIGFVSDHVTDIAPVRALPRLQGLNCGGTMFGKGSVVDLWPLKGLSLTRFHCYDTQVADLTPLKGMKLTELLCFRTKVADLSAVADMPLTRLQCDGTTVADLSPLKKMKLQQLRIEGTRVTDLAVLKGMPLNLLVINYTAVADLSPLRGMKLETLEIKATKVKDLSVLHGMPLTWLSCQHAPIANLAPLKDMKLKGLDIRNTKVADFSPLGGMPLKELWCDVRPGRNADGLDSIKSLETINEKPMADFRKEYGYGPFAPLDKIWLEKVKSLKAEDQVKEVVAEITRRNPGFEAKPIHTAEGPVVTNLDLRLENVTDVTPVKALTGLKRIIWREDWRKRRFHDLSPVAGLKLTTFDGEGSLVSDLRPLKGMPLAHLNGNSTLVHDLTPLRGMPLHAVALAYTAVSDLMPLQGMKLKSLYCPHTPVADLAPLKGMPLELLWCQDTKVTDLSPLKGMPLRELVCDFKPFRDTEVLRSIKSLSKINFKPAQEFWKEVDDKQAAFDAWLKQVTGLPAEKQIEAVAKKLQDLNPGFDGKTTHKNEGGVVTELTFSTENVSDVAPVRALASLATLRCNGGEKGKGRLADLSPLKGMKLTKLSCGHSLVADLSPLKNMKLATLWCAYSNVTDLSPLMDMKLTELYCSDSPVSDLSPLRNMKLKVLWCVRTKVADLSPLSGMDLAELHCSGTQVSDLSPLKDMKLRLLACRSANVVDLSPLKEIPLKEIRCDFTHPRDAEIVRSIKTLEKINGQPVEKFWKEHSRKGSVSNATLPTEPAWATLGRQFQGEGPTRRTAIRR